MNRIVETQIEVLSVYSIIERLKNSSRIYDACISIGDPGFIAPEGLKENVKYLLELRFHDINRKNELDRNQNTKLPSRYDIKKIIDFYNDTREKCNGYTIHCHAGVHRSVAVAMIILYMMNPDLEYVKNRISKIKAFPLPNKKMLNTFDRINKSSLSSLIIPFENRIRDFLEDKLEIDKDDYLEELDVVE